MWFPDAASEQYVAVRVKQIGFAPGLRAPAARAIDTVGTWRQTPTKHVVTFYPAGAAELKGGGKWKLVLGQETLTLDLKGATRWTHTFVCGQTQASTMHDGGRILPIVVDCKGLEVQVDPTVGHVHLQFAMMDGDDPYAVDLDVLFGRIYESDAEKETI